MEISKNFFFLTPTCGYFFLFQKSLCAEEEMKTLFVKKSDFFSLSATF